MNCSYSNVKPLADLPSRISFCIGLPALVGTTASFYIYNHIYIYIYNYIIIYIYTIYYNYNIYIYICTADVQVISGTFQFFRFVLFFAALHSHAFSDVGWRCARSCCKLCSSEPSFNCHKSRVLFLFYAQSNYDLYLSDPKSVHLLAALF